MGNESCRSLIFKFVFTIVFICYFSLTLLAINNENYFLNGIVSKQEEICLQCLLQSSAAVNRLLEDNSDCQESALEEFTLFLTLPPLTNGIIESRRFLLPTLRVFWPFQYSSHLKIVVILDGEASGIERYARWVQKEINKALPESTQVDVKYNFPTIKFSSGWNRQQWIMFWADNFTTSNYVGFVDSDAIFVTRILPKDLFQNGKPVVRGLFGKPRDSWWAKTTKASAKAIGTLEPFNCMSYFPVVLKTNDLKPMRSKIIQQFDNVYNFDFAFEKLMDYSGSNYSQFSIMCNYLFNYRQDQYHWTLYERRPHDTEFKFLDTQTGWTNDIRRYFNQSCWRPGISAHWSYERYKRDVKNLTHVVRAGVCNSMPELSSLCGNSSQNRRHENINDYEWTFEGFNWALADRQMALKANERKLEEINHCPQKYDSGLLEIIRKYFQ